MRFWPIKWLGEKNCVPNTAPPLPELRKRIMTTVPFVPPSFGHLVWPRMLERWRSTSVPLLAHVDGYCLPAGLGNGKIDFSSRELISRPVPSV